MRRHLATLILLAAIRSSVIAAAPTERGTRPGWIAQASGTTNTLMGVWGADLSTVFVVGKAGTVLRWDGRTWSAISIGSASSLTSLWGASPDDLFVAGDGGLILHFDGTAWTKQETGTAVNLDAVWGSSGHDVFAVGDADGTILHFDGKAWRRMASGTDAPLFGVWGSGPRDVYAVGMGATVLRFDGEAWEKVATGVEAHFTGVWGSSASDVFAVGTGGTVAHYDGKSWTRMATGSTQHLTRVWGSGPADVYAVGAGGAVVQFDGTAWNSMASDTAVSLYGVWSAAGSVFAVGREGTLLRLDPPVDAHAFVQTLDEAGTRQEWPGFDPSEWPIAVYDGTRTLLFHHPSPPPGFTPLPERPGVLAMSGRHPAVAGNSVRDIGGVRTATVAPRPGRPPEDAMLAVVEELFHVFWNRRHTNFRPNEMARYAYPVKEVRNLRLVLAEDEALARALEADSLLGAAEWAAAALGIRHERELHLTADDRAFEIGLEMMEGTANAVARSVVGQRPEATGARLRLDWPAEEIRWRFYNTGAAVCFLLDRFRPGWKPVVDRDLEQTTVGLLEAALAGTDAKPAAFSEAELAGFERRAAASGADLSARQKKLRDELAGRAGTRILLEVPEGLPPLRVVRFDPLGVFVLDGGEAVHPGTLALSVPDGVVEVTNPGFTPGSFAGSVALTRGAGRHPFAGGIRTLTIVGVTGTPKVDAGGNRLTIEAEGVRISLPGAVVESAGDTLRVSLPLPARSAPAAVPGNGPQAGS